MQPYHYNENQLYLAEEGLLDIPTRENVTPLWLAVGREDDERVSKLLKKGADPNIKSSKTFDCPNGRFGPCSILDLAHFRGNEAIIQSLMIFGAKKSNATPINLNGVIEWLPTPRKLHLTIPQTWNIALCFVCIFTWGCGKIDEINRKLTL